jgi:NADPH:quinone reductase-like Zn-dependent oxidoreductase
MRALTVVDDVPGRIALREAPDPTPGPDQALIRVEAISLNHGELPALTGAVAGTIPGWDAAGTVIQAAASGRGPAAGTRVVTRGASGGWAERRAVDVDELAIVPDDVDIAAASTLPVAAGTALRALRAVGGVLGRRVAITGASGGVGRFAVQLAHLAGAQVVAVVGSEARAAGLKELGADEVVVGIDALVEPVYAVLENVGGTTLTRAFSLLEVGGVLLSIGAASGEPSAFAPYSTVGPQRSLVSFTLGAALGADLAYLVGLLQAGRLDPQIGWRGSWIHAADASEALLARRVPGKAVLTVE